MGRHQRSLLRIPEHLFRILLLTLSFFLFVSNICHAQQSEDILGKALGEVGFTRSDLGFHPAGHWSQAPCGSDRRIIQIARAHDRKDRRGLLLTAVCIIELPDS